MEETIIYTNADQEQERCGAYAYSWCAKNTSSVDQPVDPIESFDAKWRC